MPKAVSDVVRKTPPFRHIYQVLDDLKKQQSELKKSVSKLEEFKRSSEKKYTDLEKKCKETEKKCRDLERQNASLKRQLEGTRRELLWDIRYYYHKGLSAELRPDALKEWYHMKTGDTLDLEHPKTFNQKIQWLKLNESTPEKTRLADKYRVRDWIKEKIGEEYLIPVYGVYDSFDEIDFDALPDQFVIKTNHGSGKNMVCHDKSTFDIPKAKAFFDKWMGYNFAYCVGLEMHYKDIVPKLIVEKYIQDGTHVLEEYRFFCFDGRVKDIWFDANVELKQDRKRNIYNRDWELQPFTVNYPNDPSLEKRPKNLEKMLEIAETLSAGFRIVRVDLYEINGRIYFGEMTFTPASGTYRWGSEEYNRQYGDMIKLPTDEEEEE